MSKVAKLYEAWIQKHSTRNKYEILETISSIDFWSLWLFAALL